MANKSLVNKITSGSIALIVSAFIFALTANYWHAMNQAETAHKKQLDQQLTLLSQSLENPLWSLDDNTITLIGEAYMAGVDAVSLEIFLQHNKEPIYNKEKTSSANTIYGKREITHRNQVIGHINLRLSGETHTAPLSRLLTFSIILGFFIVVSLAFIMKMLFRKHLMTPLDNLGAWTDRLAIGNYGEAPPLVELDELSSLADKFSNMAEKIQSREEELVKYRDHLKLLVEEQTQKLVKANSELLQRERLATLGRLTATVSHELRNPLGTIQTALFSIEKSLEDSKSYRATRSIELAERSISRCVRIIEELNSYARAKGLEISEGSIDNWLKEIIVEQTLPAEIDLKTDLSSAVKASFDSEKLRQVVVNIIANAIDALQDESSNGKLLQVSTHTLNGEYEIRVCDNGIGMSNETKEKIFEPLYSTKGFGVGLGMVIVKNIVEQHQGKIIIESEEEKGTKVILRFPVMLSAEE